MTNIGRLDRFLLGRTFTIGMNVVALALVGPITAAEVMRLLHEGMASAAQHGHAALSGLGAVGVVLVALGVVLEGRRTFVEKVMKFNRVTELPGQDEFCDYCELFGFYLVVLGLLIECLGELTSFLGASGGALTLLFRALCLVLSGAAIVSLVRLTVAVAQLRLTSAH